MPNVYFYQSENAKRPIDEFFKSLPDIKTKAKILSIIQRLEASGSTMLRPPESKKLTNDIWELRIKYNKNIYRLLFFTQPNETYIITNGFIKKTDKTPEVEIEKAQNYRKNYLNKI